MQISIAAEPIFKIGNFVFTNTLLVSWVIVAGLVIFALSFPKRLAAVPRGIQNALEAFLEGVFKFADSVVGDPVQTRKFFPIVLTIFLFVLFSNLVEVLPGLGTIGIYEEHEGKQVLIPFLRSSSADLNFTLAIAICSVVITHVMALRQLGVWGHVKKFINFTNPILFFVGILELVAEFAKMISFSFRLFGNIFAGEVLLIVVTGLVPFLIPLPFLFLEIFVGLIQALVFSMLTLVFLKMATTVEHH